MKIAILGGTGHFGKGVALRWCKDHEIIIGSREGKKASDAAEQFSGELPFPPLHPILGMTNQEAASHAAVAVLSLRFHHLVPFLEEWASIFAHKIVITPVVPLLKKEIFQYAAPPEGSAALAIQRLLPNTCQVVAALHTIPAADLRKLDKILEGDVVVCGDSGEAKGVVRKLVEEIKSLRVLDGGPLQTSAMVEPIVPLILNLKQFSTKRDLQIKFI